MNKLIFFASDAHLGSPILEDKKEAEKTLVAWCRAITPLASKVYFLGDMFDFWYEYKHVVPKGYVRFLNAMAEMVDNGVEVHFLVGNHDVWCKNYFSKELGVQIHKKAIVVNEQGKTLYLAHGDEEYKLHSKKEKFLYNLFRNRLAKMAFSAIHPRWTMPLGMKSSKASRMRGLKKNRENENAQFNEEWLVKRTVEKAKQMPNIDYFIYGHRHLLMEVEIGDIQKMVILGDWIKYNSYAYLQEGNICIKEAVTASNPLGIDAHPIAFHTDYASPLSDSEILPKVADYKE